MKTFLIKTLIFVLLIKGAVTLLLLTQAPYIDYFYIKFTTPKQTSLIIGDSRSLQGIQPSILNDCLKDSGYELPIFNYSFTIAQIAYGKLNTESIKKKMKDEVSNGLFILTVNPWLLAERIEDDIDSNIFFEEGKPPHNMEFVSHNPNFEYLYKNFNYFHFRSLFKRNATTHKDGWLEEKNLPKNEAVLEEWTLNQIRMYTNFANEWKQSTYRLRHLDELIVFLKQHGDVIVLSMPIDQRIKAIENDFWADFDSIMDSIANNNHTKYLNFSINDTFQTYDGNHLDKIGGMSFAKTLCNSISNFSNLNK
jgi:hypothetical protein